MSPITANASVSSLLHAVHQIEPVIRAHTADAERDADCPMPSRMRCAPVDFTGYGARGPLAGSKSTR